ncbi:hypothetical protein BC629DRAFT_1580720 [Irpex lacteus]|nr:hypothetical protein BC629DRAFT_1580720 [Irpex lacteus]
MSSATKYSLGSLPLPPSSHTLTKYLTPDKTATSPKEFHHIQRERPSTQRRARILSPETHFKGEEVTAENQSGLIERWLAKREALQEKDSTERPNDLHVYYPAEKELPRELIGLSETGLRDCLPHLDVGDAFDIIGEPQNTPRQELVDILSGYATLKNVEENMNKSWAPWSLRYSGHQFGTWAGQLGDGRAISILATPHPSNAELTYELQLKGAGRTPFSRGADGLAVVRSSIREFLCAEAMHALGIPTTRSLALVSLPELPVLRERIERACVLTRVAPSFIRIGSFEALNPPESMFFLGGGQQEKDLEALRILGEWVGRRVLRGGCLGTPAGLQSAKRNARMVAGWQAYGFMHGVINTDNVSIMGLTIDYGPYAFMDVFNPYHICNHSDGEGRYNYQAQPSVVMYALRSLLTSLAPLIGAEAERGNKLSLPTGPRTRRRSKRWMGQARDRSRLAGVGGTFQNTCAEEYKILMHKRLGLRRIDSDDESKLNRPLLNLLDEHHLDFHPHSAALHTSDLTSRRSTVEKMQTPPKSQMLDPFKAKADWKKWLEMYAERVESEKDLWTGDEGMDLQRERAIRGANPRFVLRQWVLEEVIKKVEKDSTSGRRVLRKVLQMACNPFEPWGAEDDPSPTGALDEEILEERRYCGIGEKQMLGFQCSCSS